MNGKRTPESTVKRLGAAILRSDGMKKERGFLQHGNVSVYEHSLGVALACVKLARLLRIKVDERSLVRGALLHDYFLYDWHEHDRSHRFHGFHGTFQCFRIKLSHCRHCHSYAYEKEGPLHKSLFHSCVF